LSLSSAISRAHGSERRDEERSMPVSEGDPATAGIPSHVSSRYRGWYRQQVNRGRFDRRHPAGSARNPRVATTRDEQRDVRVGEFFLDASGNTYWQAPTGARLAEYSGNGSPMAGRIDLGQSLSEAGMQADAFARGAGNYVSLGSADEGEAALQTVFSGAPLSRWPQTYHNLHQEQLARDQFDQAHRGLARNLGTGSAAAAMVARTAVTAAPRLAARGLPFAQRLARSAVTGGTMGALAGGAAPAPGESRLHSAVGGAVGGAVLGPLVTVGGDLAVRHAPQVLRGVGSAIAPYANQVFRGIQLGEERLPRWHGRTPIPVGSNAMREEARRIVRSASPQRRNQPIGDHDIHHRIPFEYTYLFPMLYPNRLANLIRLHRVDHVLLHRDEWAAFRRSLNGREPTAAEVMQAAIRIDGRLAAAGVTPGRATTRHTFEYLWPKRR
jgi:hypothetical protein